MNADEARKNEPYAADQRAVIDKTPSQCGAHEDAFDKMRARAAFLLNQAHQQTLAFKQQAEASGTFRIACDQIDAGLSSRLRTFTITKWAGKPSQLSPLKFASHGWICVSSDLLECVSCHHYLSVELPSLADTAVTVYRKAIRYIFSNTSDTVPLKTLSNANTEHRWNLDERIQDCPDFRYEIMKDLDFSRIEVIIADGVQAVVLETSEQKCKALTLFGWQKRFLLMPMHFCICVCILCLPV
ncbi:unnamed protein product [Gongylonema pulchrum]|uniref:C3HC-type domain-containing protein n=1 Tax=Gongylonema pulchrum TaxID=637853 RepID=A0A183E6U6_9BILA|nr:unnamed protein product [Gongylonema pulchrum]